MAEINNSDDIIKILFDYVLKHFKDFGHQNTGNHRDTGHQNTDWWRHNRFVETGSWSPFVETCFIRFGEGEDRANPKYKIFHCVEGWGKKPIKNFIDYVYSLRYMTPSYRKYKCHPRILCKNSDINLHDKNTNQCVLSLEHEEKGSTVKPQLKEIYKEIKKLKRNPSEFKVLISRPVWFNKHTANEGYFKSVGVYRDEIQKNLKTIVTSNNNEKWLIILIAPSPDINPTEIIFHCYEWDNEMKCFPVEHKHSIPITIRNNQWVIDNERKPSHTSEPLAST